MFKSVNEIDKFSFDDAVITGIDKAKDGLLIHAEALIVKANNSVNTNFTESYAGPSDIKITDGVITDISKCGYKYYDADGKLLKDVPNESVAKPAWGSLIKSFEGNYIPAFEKTENGYLVEVEMSEEYGTQGNSYLLNIEGSDITVTFEKYMNRVSH